MNALMKTTELTAQSELRTSREALGWTQERLAEEAGLSRSLVCSIECGAAQRMAIAMRQALRERVAASLDTDDPDAEALAALRALRRV